MFKSHIGDAREAIVVVSPSEPDSSSIATALRDVFGSFEIICVIDTSELRSSYGNVKSVIFAYEVLPADTLPWRTRFPHAFIAVLDDIAAASLTCRLAYFDAGVNMVTHSSDCVIKVLEKAVVEAGRHNGTLKCPFCDLPNLTVEELWHHCPAFHINSDESSLCCPICNVIPRGEPIQVHIHDKHRPKSVGYAPDSTKVPLYSFSLVVCRHPRTGKYLLCQEFANQGFWLPGGAVDLRERLSDAAIRETIEEAGVDVELKGILAIEQTPHRGYVRQRMIFYAEPKDLEQAPKTIPDFESAGACWATAEEIRNSRRRLRGSEPLEWTE